jgi:RimJ/RimL family protein N-acetyltransferase
MSNNEEVHKYNLCYLPYNENSAEQRKFLDECEEDRDIASFAYKVQDLISCDNEAYLVMDLDIYKYIGICVMRPPSDDIKISPTHIFICYAVIKYYRKKGYTTTIVKDIVNELFCNRNCTKVVLEIGCMEDALKVVPKYNFKIDDEYLKIYKSIGYKYITLSLSKQDYEKAKVKS